MAINTGATFASAEPDPVAVVPPDADLTPNALGRAKAGRRSWLRRGRFWAAAGAVVVLAASDIHHWHRWHWGDFPTRILAVGAVVTVYHASKAFREQSRELGVLQRQGEDQANMLEVQSAQLDAQHDQFRAQQVVNEEQVRVLKLQAEELEQSLAERQAEAEERRRSQANQVATWFGVTDMPPILGGLSAATAPVWGAFIRNESTLPVRACACSSIT